MASESTVRVKGLRQLNAALKRYDQELQGELDDRLRDIAGMVATDARGRFAAIDLKTAAGFRPRLRGFGKVVVEQRIRTKTGKRPDYGSLQMRRALLPALASHEKEIVNELERMLDQLGRKEGF